MEIKDQLEKMQGEIDQNKRDMTSIEHSLLTINKKLDHLSFLKDRETDDYKLRRADCFSIVDSKYVSIDSLRHQIVDVINDYKKEGVSVVSDSSTIIANIVKVVYQVAMLGGIGFLIYGGLAS